MALGSVPFSVRWISTMSVWDLQKACQSRNRGIQKSAVHQYSARWPRLDKAHPSVLPPSTTMTSSGGGKRLRRCRTHPATHFSSFST